MDYYSAETKAAQTTTADLMACLSAASLVEETVEMKAREMACQLALSLAEKTADRYEATKMMIATYSAAKGSIVDRSFSQNIYLRTVRWQGYFNYWDGRQSK